MPTRILIVEDEKDNIMVIKHILELLMDQKDLWFASDGHEAMRMAYEHTPDLILLDLTLPKLSGWEVARSLKSDKKFRDIPVLALTAHAMVGDRERAISAGCDDYYAKPIEIDEFISFVKTYLKKS